MPPKEKTPKKRPTNRFEVLASTDVQDGRTLVETSVENSDSKSSSDSDSDVEDLPIEEIYRKSTFQTEPCIDGRATDVASAATTSIPQIMQPLEKQRSRDEISEDESSFV